MELTCPECCCVALRKAKENRWECGTCGTSFNFSRLRDTLDMLVGHQFQEDFIDELLSDAKPEAFPELGERAWKWTGKHGILYTLDAGNGWHIVMKGSIKTRKPSQARSARAPRQSPSYGETYESWGAKIIRRPLKKGKAGGIDTVRDRGRHRKLRQKALRVLRKKFGHVLTSHTNKGDIQLFFKDRRGRHVPVAEPDIVCLDGKKAKLIVEIELGSQPKHLFGVAAANNIARHGKFRDESFDLHKSPLIVVIDPQRVKKEGRKYGQIPLIENRLNKKLVFSGIGKVKLLIGKPTWREELKSA